MSKHTPGPWSFDLETLVQDLENHISIDAPKHGSLASVVWVMEEDRDNGKNSPEQEANARLIAAAPDLLEALEMIVADWEATSGDVDRSRAYVETARAAIAKARGE